MPSFFQCMVGLGGTALIVGVIAAWVHEPQQPLSLSSGFASSPKPMMIGNSALSHGGPSSESRTLAPVSSAQFQLGQQLIVAAADSVGHVTLLTRPSHLRTPASSVSVNESISVVSGTVVLVSGMPATEPVPSQTERYYEVTIPDGRKGWLPEHALHPVTNEN